MNFIDYFQLLVLIIFLLFFLGRTIHLYSKGRKVFVIGRGKSILTNTMEILFSAGLLFWMILLVINAFHFSPGILPASITIHRIHELYLQIPGLLLISMGMFIFVLGMLSFEKSWRIGIDTNTSDKLITTGIFSYTRNPIFLFIIFYFIGTSLIYPTPVFISYALLAIFGIHRHIKKEERFLKKHYGQQYIDYTQKVKRYF